MERVQAGTADMKRGTGRVDASICKQQKADVAVMHPRALGAPWTWLSCSISSHWGTPG